LVRFFWWSGDVCVQGQGDQERWIGIEMGCEEKVYGEAADFDVSAADGVKEGGVRRGAESTRDVGSEGSVFEVCDGKGGGVDGEGRYRWWKGGENV
jgi:hypothetical protein